MVDFIIYNGFITTNTCNITNNVAINNGGGADTYNGTYNIKNSIFRNNNATNGGGFYNHNGDLSLSNVEIRNNYAIYGGGVYNLQGGLIITNSSLDNNNASCNGGAIFNTGSLNLDELKFNSNYADCGDNLNDLHVGGAALYLDSGNAVVNNCDFKGNNLNQAKYAWGGSAIAV
ncbi:MAG: hypothetical protein LBV42_02990, partial [Methanobrevibacter sp.]|nr:hypothetical protein [Methanobrevibacter sp.]